MSDLPDYVVDNVSELVATESKLGSVAWMRVALAHPDGKAVEGTPCVKCGEPAPVGLFWLLRERHVCSGRCGDNLKRQANAFAKRLNGDRRSKFEHRWEPPREVKFRDVE